MKKNQKLISFYNLKKSISFENCIYCGQNKYFCFCIEDNIKKNKHNIKKNKYNIEKNKDKELIINNLKKSISFENCIHCGQNKYSCFCIEFNTNKRNDI